MHTKIDNYEVYINNLFTLTNLNLSNTLIKGSYKEYLEKVTVILKYLCNAGLKVYTKKFKFTI